MSAAVVNGVRSRSAHEVERETAELYGVATEHEFRRELRRERAKIDRTRHVFSLMVFDVENPRTDDRLAVRLIKALNARARGTDRVGWFDAAHVAVILDSCQLCAALSLGNAICELVAREGGAPPHFTVETYPSTARGAPGVECDCGARTCMLNSAFLPTQIMVEYGTRGQRELRPPADAGVPGWKRIADIVISCLILLLVSPILLLAAAAVRLTSRGPILFRQERVGYLGKTFHCLKLRSMYADRDASSGHRAYVTRLITGEDGAADEPMRKSIADIQRNVTPVGRFLRATSIDELPQFVNVLRGEMSIVGPRPPIPYEVEAYLRWHQGRFDSVPGITGLWQVSGKNDLSFREMAKLDIQYARQLSPWLDLRIIARTPLVVLREVLELCGVGAKASGGGKRPAPPSNGA